MTATTIDPLVTVVATMLMKATLVIGLVLAFRVASARSLSASGRHLVTVLAVWVLLTLPVLAIVLPAWAPPLPVLSAPVPLLLTSATDAPGIGADGAGDVTGFTDVTTASKAPATRVPWGVLLLALQATGTSLMLIHLGMQRWRVHHLRRAAHIVTDPAWLALLDSGARRLGVHRTVRLLRSQHASMPMTFGTMRPAILLPATADTWDEARRRAVLLHELAHVARFDCLTQWAACAMRAIYWLHPGAWWLVSRVRLDREFACDDLVLAAGAPPDEYARHLLDIAYTFGGGRAPALAVRMARRSQLEGRLRALLDDSRTRREPSRPVRMATTIGAFAVLLPLASLTSPVPRIVEGSGTVEPTRHHETAISHEKSAVTAAGEVTAAAGAGASHAVAAVQAAAAQPAQPVDPGENGCTWEVGRATGDTLHLSMRQGRSQNGRTVPIAALEGLSAAQLAAGGPVRFAIRRDAGAFTFDGTARDGVAAGVCSFTPSPTFGAELAKRGVSGLTASDQRQLAHHDIGLAFVDELRTQKYTTPAVADLVKAGQHGVGLEYLRGMGGLGYATGTLEPLIKLRDHGVTPDYARALASLGYKSLPVEQLQRARDHGISAEYVQGMRDGGFGSMPLDQLITLRDHGVTPDFAKSLAAVGYTSLSPDQLQRARDHGVTAEYVQGMRDAGVGSSLSLDQLIATRDHGVTPEYVKEMKALGLTGPLAELVRARDHGVTTAYVTEVKAIGYTSLSVNDFVTLRDHGITAERIKQANAKAGSQLSVEALRDVAVHGWR